MPLDPQADALLRRLRESGAPPLHTLTPDQARQAHNRSTAEVGAPGEPVSEVHEAASPGPDGDVPVRIYVPREAGAGTLVYIHGGGWVVGTLDSFDGVCRALANRSRMTVVSVDYRLAPEHSFPAALTDCVAVVDWVGSGAAEPLVQRSPLIVAGDSAGGNLAALISIRARDTRQPAIAGQVLLYPITDASMSSGSYRELGEGYYLTAADMAWYWDLYLGPERGSPDPAFSPLHEDDLSGLPPALVITAGYDPLRDEGEAYARRLREAGTEVELRRFDGMLHGFVRFAALFDEAAEALDTVGGFVRSHWAAEV